MAKRGEQKGSAAGSAEWEREQAERIALIERLEQEESARLSLRASMGETASRARNFDPGASSRFSKLRALSRFLLLAGYLLLGLGITGIGVTIYLWREGTITSPGVLALAIVGWVAASGFVFALFKFLGELAWLLADLGDHQVDVRNLLIDLRDDLQREWTSRR